MTVTRAVRLQVRQRADFACEFCGISESDAGGELTLDHFQPRARGGSDDLDNLLYTCARCNQYKADYWPSDPNAPVLWNPRREPDESPFVALPDGRLHALTPTGAFTLERLRLNRAALVSHRLIRRRQAEEQRLLARYRDLMTLLERLTAQQDALLGEQRLLLEEQRKLIRLLLKAAE